MKQQAVLLSWIGGCALAACSGQSKPVEPPSNTDAGMRDASGSGADAAKPPDGHPTPGSCDAGTEDCGPPSCDGGCDADACAGDGCGCDEGYVGNNCDQCASGYTATSDTPLVCAPSSCDACGVDQRCDESSGECCSDACDVTAAGACDAGRRNHCVLEAGSCAAPQSMRCDRSLCDCPMTQADVHASQWGGFAAANGVAVDPSGQAFVVGFVDGLPGHSTADGDLFVAGLRPDRLFADALLETFGTDEYDEAWGVGVTSDGNVLVGGTVEGPFEDEQAAGFDDLLVTSWSGSGTMNWATQWGSSSSDRLNALHVDANDAVYAGGLTYGVLPGSGASDTSDAQAFVSRLNAQGMVQWTVQWGGESVDGEVFGLATATDGHVLAGGVDDDGLFCRKLDAGDGHELWTADFGTGTAVFAIAATPDGGCLAGGLRSQAAGGFLAKASAAGEVQWTRAIEHSGSFLSVTGVTMHPEGESAVISGHVRGEIVTDAAQGGLDVFVQARRLTDGDAVWTQQAGTASDDSSNGIAIAPDGHDIFVAGTTLGTFPGHVRGAEGFNALLIRFAP